MISITKERYRDLLEAEAMLQALEVAGVYNWEGYDYAMEEYFNCEDKENIDECDRTACKGCTDTDCEHYQAYPVKESAHMFVIGDRVVFTNKGSDVDCHNGIVGTVVDDSIQNSLVVEFDCFSEGWGRNSNRLYVTSRELTLI